MGNKKITNKKEENVTVNTLILKEDGSFCLIANEVDSNGISKRSFSIITFSNDLKNRVRRKSS